MSRQGGGTTGMKRENNNKKYRTEYGTSGKNKKIQLHHVETISALQVDSKVNSSYIFGTLSSMAMVLIILSAVIASSMNLEIRSIATVSDFHGVFAHGSDLRSSSSSSGYPGSRIVPSLCRDGYTYGYSDWNTLSLAIEEANLYAESLVIAAESEWIIDESGALMPSELPPLPEPFVICPGITLKTGNRRGPILINSEDIIIQCDSCIIDGKGTHFSFGENAKRAMIKGITFINAKTTSLTFYYHGADVAFEDCIWEKNAGIGQLGAVADINSTSSVTFFRCEISDKKQVPRATGYGTFGGISSLTIRE